MKLSKLSAIRPAPEIHMSRLILALLLAVSAPAALAQATEKATFAAGCFWCAEEAFEKVPEW